jgi:hypothetical protein
MSPIRITSKAVRSFLRLCRYQLSIEHPVISFLQIMAEEHCEYVADRSKHVSTLQSTSIGIHITTNSNITYRFRLKLGYGIVNFHSYQKGEMSLNMLPSTFFRRL